LWLHAGACVLASSGQQAAAFFRSTTLDEETLIIYPHEADEYQTPYMESMIIPLSTVIELGLPGVPCMTWNVALLQPFTTRSVELTSSTNPEAQPKIKLLLLTDQRDAVQLQQAVRFAMICK
jgi:hypothetical protein